MKRVLAVTIATIIFTVLGQMIPGTVQVFARQATNTPPADSQSVENEQQVPQYLKYLLFFRHLAALDEVAAKKEASGKDAAGWRSHEQRAAGLSDTEGKILKEVAYECNREVKDVDERTMALVKALRARNPNAQPADILENPSVMELRNKRIEVINSHIVDLQVKLGTAAFDKIDRHIRSNFKVESSPLPLKSNSPSKNPGGVQ